MNGCKYIHNQRVLQLHLGSARSCCKRPSTVFNETQNYEWHLLEWQKQQTALNLGSKLEGCEYCWQAEDQGKKSFRQQKDQLEAQYGTRPSTEFFLSNACNFQCAYCSPKFSSTWARSIKELGHFDNISDATKQNHEIPQFVKDQAYFDRGLADFNTWLSKQEDDSQVISILGGEPLMQKKTLLRMLEFPMDKIKAIRINTNGSPPNLNFLNDIIHWAGSKLHLTLSLDCRPEYNHIPRAGFDRNQFNLLMEIVNKNHIPHSIISTLSVLSIWDIGKFSRWCHERSIQHEFYPLQNPDCLDVSILPYSFLNNIHKINWDDWHLVPENIRANFLSKSDHTTDLNLLRESYHYLTEYFRRCNIIVPDNIVLKQHIEWLAELVSGHSLLG